MTITEEEARGKQCPLSFGDARAPETVSTSTGGWSMSARMPGFTRHCIASACMAWRWSESQRVILKGAIIQDEKHSITMEEAIKGGHTEYTLVPGRRGYCGLAGAP